MAYQVIQYLPAGRGRDFCVGDIHGAFDLVAEGLDAVGFDPAIDRLFSVGDLVDRGAYSDAALEFLAEPWVYSIRGNHEQTILDLHRNGDPDPREVAFQVQRNGFGWWLDLPLERRLALLAAFAKLPIALEVATPRGTVGLIHAEVPRGMDWATFKAKLTAWDQETVTSALWGRTRAKLNDQSGVPGIGRIFAGHTPQFNGIRKLGNCYLVDLGAVYGHSGTHANGRLSMTNVLTATQFMPAPQRLPLVNLLDIEGDGPFGTYAPQASSSWLSRLCGRS